MFLTIMSRIVMRSVAALVLAAILTFGPGAPAQGGTFRVGALKFGTVDWLLDVIKAHKFDEREGFVLDVIDMASNSALQVALLGGEADAVVTDWFWVLRQRAMGEDFVFTPYSAALGAVIVPADSAITAVDDLKGKRIGVAGSPLDKSWLILRAHGVRSGAGDFARTAAPVFAAPPLLNQQLQAGELDAALNFWRFTAPLEGAGYRRLASVGDLMKELGLDATIPLVGFVFRESLAAKEPKTVNGFVRAVIAAQSLLLSSDAEWDRLRPRVKAASEAEFQALRKSYQEGILARWGSAEREAAARLFDILAATGGPAVVGEGVSFDKGIFWGGLVY